jgi:hypothetical protein
MLHMFWKQLRMRMRSGRQGPSRVEHRRKAALQEEDACGHATRMFLKLRNSSKGSRRHELLPTTRSC